MRGLVWNEHRKQLEQASDLSRSGDWDAAIALYKEIIEKNPTDPNAAYAENCLAELRERQNALGMSKGIDKQLKTDSLLVDGHDVVFLPDVTLPKICFKCASTNDVSKRSIRVMKKGIPLVTFDKTIASIAVPVCHECRKRKWRTRVIGLVSIVSVVLFPIGAFLLLRRWDYATAFYNGKYFRIPNVANSVCDAIRRSSKQM